MGKRLAIYSGLLGATLALAALSFVKLDASLSDLPDAGWPLSEVTGKAPSATRPRAGEGWIHFEWTTFVDTQGNFVSAGLVYVMERPGQAERKPIVRETYVGIMYKLAVPSWHSIYQGIQGPTPAVDVHLLHWVDVLHTGVAGQGQ